ncbi:MAG TPA: methyltransferase [Opitutaceae bacterium]|nr:methyltransferase [Opitutaceae bacterium]
MNALLPTPELEVPSVAFFGRTLAEYSQFFSLDIATFKGRSVLDVAAGPSSFTAEACKRGVDAVAVDPLYGCTGEALEQHVAIDYRNMISQMQAKRHLFRFKTFGSFEEAEISRRSAADRFLADYAAHFVHGRYIGATLPLLPFFDRAFDTVLCAHLLFVYAKRFDFDFHLAACRELVRVSRDDVRIHPIVGTNGRKYPELGRLRIALAEEGIDSQIVDVDYEFFAGSDSMLVLKRKET